MLFSQASNAVGWGNAVVVVVLASLGGCLYASHRKLVHVPTIGGPSWPILSYIGAFRFFTEANEMFLEGCARYQDRIFKVALMDRWLLVVPNRKLMAELAAVPEDILSFSIATNELIEGDYTFGPEVLRDPYHIESVKRNLTKNLTALFPAINEEVCDALDEYIPATDDWTAIPAMETAMLVVARTSNRIFTGLPLCRDKRFLELNINFTIQVMVAGMVISMFPKFLKPFLGRYLSQVPKAVKEAIVLLAPEISRRRTMAQQYGRDYPDKPNDFLSWVMDDAAGDPVHDTDRDLSLRVLGINFAAVHTTSNTFTHALLTLAARPDDARVIREEVDSVLETDGLTKESLVKMTKLDSFLRESARLNTFPGQSLSRVAMKPYTFSDGTFVPVGTLVSAVTLPPQRDEAAFASAGVFDAFRFEQPPDGEGARKQLTSTDLSFLAFGHGKHACPGRFFAGNEMKTMFVHMLRNYEMRTEVEGVRPKDTIIGPTALPDAKAKVLFRKRRA